MYWFIVTLMAWGLSKLETRLGQSERTHDL